MFVDMVGFTAAAQEDEARTLRLLSEQEELIRPVLLEHQGREVKSTGDGFLVEFESALKATQCAVAIQRRIRERNAGEPGHRITVRIGIHLGDVEQRGSDIFGDAVNIASRVEGVAEPGGVCVSGAVHEQVRNKTPDRLERLTPKRLKGLQLPIDVYRVVLPWEAEEIPRQKPGPRRLAVLPFTNISPDPEDAYFADGLTEELITVLARLAGLQVIARTSVMQYKASSKGITQIGNELNVSSILEGSVRKDGSHLRITVQLVDPLTEGHLWAKAYDRELENVFALQTEIARAVVESLEPELRADQEPRIPSRPPVRPDSYVAYLKGRAELYATTDLDSRNRMEAARRLFELAISLDPQNAAAHSGLADIVRILGWNYPESPRAEWDARGRLLAARAVELDPNLAEAHASMAIVRWDDFDYPAAEQELRTALSLNPSYSLAHHWYDGILEEEGRADEALQEALLAEAADPLWGLNLFHLAMLLIWVGRPGEALSRIKKIGELEPTGPGYHFALVRYHLSKSDRDSTLREMQETYASMPEARWTLVYRALYHSLAGDPEPARALLTQQEAMPDFPPLQWIIVWIYLELGDLDACFRWLDRGLRSRNVPLRQARLDPRFEPLRADPRWGQLLRTMNLA
jgi:adenylate cyclase